jgi:phosphatidylglycerol lysyltransferase
VALTAQVRSSDATALQQARQLVLQQGRNATAYQIINPGIDLWFSGNERAVAGYVDSARFRVIAGAPVCEPARLSAVIQELEEEARALGRRVCYFGAEQWMLNQLEADPNHVAALLGAQPAWHPQSWPKILASRASLRAQLYRARNKDVSVQEWPEKAAAANPILHRCLAEWLETRGLPPMHFLVEPETLECLQDRRVFVAVRSGEVAGFLVASPVPRRHGWLIEQIVRGRRAVNGTSELLIDAAIRALDAEGYDYVTLGLAALSKRAGLEDSRNPFWLRFIFGWVRAHGRRFYNFEGLDAFKAKFQPDYWEPIYAITNERRFSFSALYAISGAFSEDAPVRMVSVALFRALRTEWHWLMDRVFPG